MKLFSTCPYCNAKATTTDSKIREYACGSFIVKATGIYVRRCR